MFKKSRYKALGGKSRRYLDTETGATISRRTYQKLSEGLSFEEKAATNFARDAKAAILRPAKGRQSQRKAVGLEREMVAEMRLEERERITRAKTLEKETRKIERTIQRKINRKVKQKKVTKQLLKAGSYGARISFVDYEGYLKAQREAVATGVIIAYSLGLVGVDENTGQDRGITVFPLRFVTDVIDRDTFDEEMTAAIERYSYFMVSHYFMHLAYKKDFARGKKSEAKSRGKKTR